MLKKNKRSSFMLVVSFVYFVFFSFFVFSTDVLNSPTTEISYLEDFFNSTNGNFWSWHYPTSIYGKVWDFSTEPVQPCDKWQGITCKVSPFNNSIGNVIALQLLAYNLSGKIPNQLNLLPQLERLNLKYNEIKGILPTSVCNLTNLYFLHFGANEFTGSIPSCIVQNLSQLSFLSLYNNQLEHRIPNFT
jgi:Leucine-rich repeat (LRR) protein